eukprot:Skav235185  [mRNA]  locus=scaffold721:362894:366472:- [translate_table: standard]
MNFSQWVQLHGKVYSEKEPRIQGLVAPVRNQKALGSCWAVSTAEAVEGADCGMFGGWPYLAYQFLQQAGGIFSEADWPYYKEGMFPCMPKGKVIVVYLAASLTLQRASLAWIMLCWLWALARRPGHLGRIRSQDVRLPPLKNSWGTSWGEQGFFRLERGTGRCGVNLAATVARVDSTIVV